MFFPHFAMHLAASSSAFVIRIAHTHSHEWQRMIAVCYMAFPHRFEEALF